VPAPTTTTIAPALVAECESAAASDRDQALQQAQQQETTALNTLSGEGVGNSSEADSVRATYADQVAQIQQQYSADVQSCQSTGSLPS
jgi:hypothetical protein